MKIKSKIGMGLVLKNWMRFFLKPSRWISNISSDKNKKDLHKTYLNIVVKEEVVVEEEFDEILIEVVLIALFDDVDEELDCGDFVLVLGDEEDENGNWLLLIK